MRPPTQLSSWAFPALDEKAQVLELAESLEGARTADAQAFLDDTGVEHRLLQREVDKLVGGASGRCPNGRPISLTKIGQFFGTGNSVDRLGFYPYQEEAQPRIEVASLPDVLKRLVVPLSPSLKVRGQVEQRFWEPITHDQEENDQQPAKPAVAVEERVDRLELIMHERSLYEWG